jgi:hypothetical protein
VWQSACRPKALGARDFPWQRLVEEAVQLLVEGGQHDPTKIWHRRRRPRMSASKSRLRMSTSVQWTRIYQVNDRATLTAWLQANDLVKSTATLSVSDLEMSRA